MPTVEEVLSLVAEYRQHNILMAVDLKAENVEQDVVRLAEKHKVLHRLLFIGENHFRTDRPKEDTESLAKGSCCGRRQQHR